MIDLNVISLAEVAMEVNKETFECSVNFRYYFPGNGMTLKTMLQIQCYSNEKFFKGSVLYHAFNKFWKKDC